jgi:hypothetical protein
VTSQRAERIVVTALRLLAVAFAVTGILFIVAPDGVIGTIEDVGSELGDFSPGADSDQRVWLALGFAYMVVITGIALVAQSDVVRFRPLLLLLAAGKVASSVAAGAFFLFEEDVFAYLVNFVVDGALVGLVLWCWALAGRVTRGTPSADERGRRPSSGQPAAEPRGDADEAAARAPAAPG